MHKTPHKRLIVIGGGAAGFFCAVNAARLCKDLEVIIIEKSNKLLSKVRVSGGGRCNVTHSCFSISDMIKKYPRGDAFLKKAFHHFFTTDTIQWFKERVGELKTEADGRMFPVSNSSETIIECLLREASKYKIQIQLNRVLKNIQPNEHGFLLECNDQESLQSDFVCVATGGFPKASGYDWLKQTGHSIALPVPSLFTFNMPGNAITQLMGITVDMAVVKIIGTKYVEQGPLLITHWGMSGPAILKLSAWAARTLSESEYTFSILVNWLPSYNEQSLKNAFQQIRFEKAAQKISNKNPFGLPLRLWQYLLQQSGVDENIRWADLPSKEQNKLIKNCCAHEFQVKGKTTFKEEFVTAGGVQLNEIDHQTMESKLLPGLFFAGEVIDVDGITGGFNFQNAWTTGFLAAQGIAQKCTSKVIE
ncbi:MAG: NAD(P)/FAD-dependent oxidoreductase [Ferruginibacter sp.]